METTVKLSRLEPGILLNYYICDVVFYGALQKSVAWSLGRK